jgi:hypothetical protein
MSVVFVSVPEGFSVKFWYSMAAKDTRNCSRVREDTQNTLHFEISVVIQISIPINDTGEKV